MEPTIIICRCMKVDRATIVKAIREGAATVAEVEEKTGASGGCGRCGRSIQALIDHPDA